MINLKKWPALWQGYASVSQSHAQVQQPTMQNQQVPITN